MLIYQLITKQKTHTHTIHFQLPYGIKGTHKLWRIGSYIYIYIYIKGVFGLSLFLLKLKTKTENTVAK